MANGGGRDGFRGGSNGGGGSSFIAASTLFQAPVTEAAQPLNNGGGCNDGSDSLSLSNGGSNDDCLLPVMHPSSLFLSFSCIIEFEFDIDGFAQFCSPQLYHRPGEGPFEFNNGFAITNTIKWLR